MEIANSRLPIADEDQQNRRLPVQTVERLHRAVGGDARVEDMILRFIGERYRARSLFYLPEKIAGEVLKRPADFIRAAKQFCEPELNF